MPKGYEADTIPLVEALEACEDDRAREAIGEARAAASRWLRG